MGKKFLTKKKYSTYESWLELFPDNKIYIENLHDNLDESWYNFFTDMRNEGIIDKINENLTKSLQNIGSVPIHPSPNLLFNAFKMTPFNEIKVVFIGQDPYFDHEMYNDKKVSQAMGLSFSVPQDFKIPSSLQNIFKNLLKFQHIDSLPEHGNLEKLAKHGCLMLNTSLTVIDGSDNKKCHTGLWKKFTDCLIRYISENSNNIIFVIWGADAFSKMNMIDLDKHEAIITSHPSGLSADKPFKNYQSFNSFDHFGKINELLKKYGKKKIKWQKLINI
jgi:uracil-DNA glycosylase